MLLHALSNWIFPFKKTMQSVSEHPENPKVGEEEAMQEYSFKSKSVFPSSFSAGTQIQGYTHLGSI